MEQCQPDPLSTLAVINDDREKHLPEAAAN